MAKIDVSKIEGFDNMTAEQKVEALSNYDVVEPDYSGYVKKDVFDRTAHELAEAKKALKSKMTTDEEAAQAAKEAQEQLQQDYAKLLRETNISKAKAKLLALGYEETLADDTAEAMIDNNTEKIFVNQKKHLEAVAKAAHVEGLKNTSRPHGGNGSEGMTLDKLQKMSVTERFDYVQQHPAEYKELYGGNT